MLRIMSSKSQSFLPESSHATRDVNIVNDELRYDVSSEHDGYLNHDLKLLPAPI
jgi:hypothetical protein